MMCPQCHGLGCLLGRLGRLVWYRCRACGWEFSVSAAELEDDWDDVAEW